MVTKARFDQQHQLPDGPRSGLRVLIVDDDADTADTMVILLSHWGFQVAAVCSGIEALRAAQADSPPDVILLDIGMPGMDGFEVARRVRKQVPGNGRRPFLIAVSGYGDAQTRTQAQQSGIDLQLVKPVDPAELEKLLKRFQGVVMPAAERIVRRGQQRMRRIPSLRFCSEQAMLNQCVATAAAIRANGHKLKINLWEGSSTEARISIRDEWCQQAARFLDESEKVRQLLASFRKQSIH